MFSKKEWISFLCIVSLFGFQLFAESFDIIGHWYSESGSSRGSSELVVTEDGFFTHYFPDLTGRKNDSEYYYYFIDENGIKVLYKTIFTPEVYVSKEDDNSPSFDIVRIIGDRMQWTLGSRTHLFQRIEGTKSISELSGTWESDTHSSIVIDDMNLGYFQEYENVFRDPVTENHRRASQIFLFIHRDENDYAMVNMAQRNLDISESIQVNNQILAGELFRRVSGDVDSVAGEWERITQPSSHIIVDDENNLFMKLSRQTDGSYNEYSTDEIEILPNQLNYIWRDRSISYYLFEDGQRMLIIKNIYTRQ